MTVPGPLHGIRVVEIGGIGPGPFCAMMLADMGAEVIRVDRRQDAAAASARQAPRFDPSLRNRRSVAVDLKNPAGVEAVLALVERADALVEGFRPGVMERLGLGPDACLARNRKLVYGRMTGWGQSGPLAQAAGHDINYISITGALHAIGTRDSGPVPPLNLVGDYGGGAMMLAFGVVSGLLEASRSGCGQVVDAAMTDGAALLCAYFYGQRAAGTLGNQRASHMLDGGAPFYGVFECSDGRFVSIASIEPQFYALLVERLQLDPEEFAPQLETSRWPALKQHLAELFRRRPRDHWCRLLEGSDACFAPVLDWDEAPAHPHNVARRTFVEFDGVIQPAPAPRFSRTPGALRIPPGHPGEHTRQILRDWGFSDAQVTALERAGAISQGCMIE